MVTAGRGDVCPAAWNGAMVSHGCVVDHPGQFVGANPTIAVPRGSAGADAHAGIVSRIRPGSRRPPTPNSSCEEAT